MNIKNLIEKYGKKKLIIIGLCVIIILGLGSTALVLFFQNKNKIKTSYQLPSASPSNGLPVTANTASKKSESAGPGGSNESNASNKNNENGGSNESNESNSSASDAPSTSDNSSGTPSPNIFGSIDSAPIDDIENSLALVFTDSLNDYTNPGGGYPPEGVYSYSPIDQYQTYMGVKNNRLYIKWTLGGNIPTKQESTEGNTIKSVTYNMAIDTDGNANNGWLGSETHLQLNIEYKDDGTIWITPWFRANYLGGGGEGNFEKTGDGVLYSSNGGLGKNYFIISYSLADLLGTVNLGQNVNFNFWSEAQSNLWHHFSFDKYQWVPWNVWGI